MGIGCHSEPDAGSLIRPLRCSSPVVKFLIPGVIATLQSYGIVVPDDVSLICFDDVDWFSFTVPKITAISSSQSRLAEAAVTLLLTRIERPEQR